MHGSEDTVPKGQDLGLQGKGAEVEGAEQEWGEEHRSGVVWRSAEAEVERKE